MIDRPADEEAAAIAAAVQRFQVETSAASPGPQPGAAGPWQRAALVEGVGKQVTIEDLEGEGGARWLS